MARYVVIFHPNDPVPDRLKIVDDATTGPTSTDDAGTLGVTIGSLWIDTVNGRVYICEDPTTSAAVWIELTGAGSSALDDLSDVTITGPETDGDGLVYDGSAWVDRPSGRHMHIVGESITFDGTATVYYLANQAEQDSVAAFDKDGHRVAITHDTVALDKVTFGVAPAAGTGWMDYVAAID